MGPVNSSGFVLSVNRIRIKTESHHFLITVYIWPSNSITHENILTSIAKKWYFEIWHIKRAGCSSGAHLYESEITEWEIRQEPHPTELSHHLKVNFFYNFSLKMCTKWIQIYAIHGQEKMTLVCWHSFTLLKFRGHEQKHSRYWSCKTQQGQENIGKKKIPH